MFDAGVDGLLGRLRASDDVGPKRVNVDRRTSGSTCLERAAAEVRRGDRSFVIHVVFDLPSIPRGVVNRDDQHVIFNENPAK
jgi:hypothetical protein